jgi:hypothetical protein
MVLAKVVGTLVSTQKESSMDGLKFLVLQNVDIDGKSMQSMPVLEKWYYMPVEVLPVKQNKQIIALAMQL